MNLSADPSNAKDDYDDYNGTEANTFNRVDRKVLGVLLLTLTPIPTTRRPKGFACNGD